MRMISSIPVTNNITGVDELNGLISEANKLRNTNPLHAKKNPDGSFELYVSKGKGTGFKKFFFPEKMANRKFNARLAIIRATKNAVSEEGRRLHASMVNPKMPQEAPLNAKLFEHTLQEVVDAELHAHATTYATELLDKINPDLEDMGEVTKAERKALGATHHSACELSDILGLSFRVIEPEDDEVQINFQERPEDKKKREDAQLLINEKTKTFIAENSELANSPFGSNRPFTSILNKSKSIQQDMGHQIGSFFKKGLHRDEKEIRDSAEALSVFMNTCLKELKFSGELLTNQKFLETLPADSREAARKLGLDNTALHKVLSSKFEALANLAGIALKSPRGFSAALEQYEKLHSSEPLQIRIFEA